MCFLFYPSLTVPFWKLWTVYCVLKCSFLVKAIGTHPLNQTLCYSITNTITAPPFIVLIVVFDLGIIPNHIPCGMLVALSNCLTVIRPCVVIFILQHIWFLLIPRRTDEMGFVPPGAWKVYIMYLFVSADASRVGKMIVQVKIFWIAEDTKPAAEFDCNVCFLMLISITSAYPGSTEEH